MIHRDISPQNILVSYAAYSWIKNVESNWADGDHVRIHYGFRNEVRDSYFHDEPTPGPDAAS